MPCALGTGVSALRQAHAGYSFEQTLERFLAEVGGRVDTKPWQIQQASDAIRIYRYPYRGAKAGDADSPTAQALVDDAARLERREERAAAQTRGKRPVSA